jgi:SAM-dependent MidA family methyltransferase
MPPAAQSLLCPSALLSSRWSRDNLITPEVARLYTGAVRERVGVEELQRHLARLSERNGPLEVETGSLGVLSWNIRCARGAKRSLLLLPLVSDGEGVGGRSKRLVPERAFEHARQFRRQKLNRYLLTPEHLFEVDGVGRGASFSLPDGYSTLSFGLGSARLDLLEADEPRVLYLDRSATAEVTTELLAALAYHYDERDGTAVADVLINDGDFLARRTADGTFEVRLTAARRLEGGIEANRFILFLVQLMAYEDWHVGEDLVGLPVLVSSPSLACAGLVRGLGLRYQDLGRGRSAGEEAARSLLAAFARSRQGRGYAPWVGRFLAGSGALADDWADDPRRPWWNLAELEQRRDLLRLREGEERAKPLATLIEHLVAAVGRGTWDDQVPAPAVSIASADEEGTLAALDRLPKARPVRAVANPEVYGGTRAAAEHVAELARLLPSFESYMDDVLHEPRFGYYAHRVQIGHGGHFSTHPESLSPHYGRWVASWAFEVYRRLLDGGHLTLEDAFPLVEFGAGNGRLARDVVDQVKARSQSDRDWRAFAERLDYRIYELSPALRSKQEGLLAGSWPAVVVGAGDARNPAAALERDFPAGLSGLIVSNELPDAFGVHKVLLAADGAAEAVLVAPRIEAELARQLPPVLVAACHAANARLRELLSASAHTEDLLLDQTTFRDVMTFVYSLPEPGRSAAVDGLWFEEVLAPVATFPGLSQVLAWGAAEYAHALAGQQSGVVLYVNVHAVTYVRELGAALRAGQILTIDYGDTTLGLVHAARQGKFPLRIYQDDGDYHPRPNDPYARPGGQDVTADVNFTDLALAGEESGLELCCYGPERLLAGAELPLVLASTDQLPFATFASNPVFKVLALGREVLWSPEGPGLDRLSLFAATLASGCNSPLQSHENPPPPAGVEES